MPIPNFASKHDEDPLVTPQEFVQWARKRWDRPEGSSPEGVILVFQDSFARTLVEAGRIERMPIGFSLFSVKGSPSVGVVAGFGIGAPAMATTVEEVIALGARKLIIAGTAGALGTDLGIGDVVVASEAIRDEGVSYHYLADGEPAMPSALLTDALTATLIKRGRSVAFGPTWTVDAPYKETIAEVRHYQDHGVLTVEMEAAALFAVATHRGVDAAAAFSISDSLADLVWEPQFDSDETAAGLSEVFEAAVDVLAG